MWLRPSPAWGAAAWRWTCAGAGPMAVAPNLWPLSKKLAKGRPLMTIRGQTSDILDPKVAQRMRKTAPHMRYVEVPGVAHAPMLTEPAAAEAIQSFLAET